MVAMVAASMALLKDSAYWGKSGTMQGFCRECYGFV